MLLTVQLLAKSFCLLSVCAWVLVEAFENQHSLFIIEM